MKNLNKSFNLLTFILLAITILVSCNNPKEVEDGKEQPTSDPAVRALVQEQLLPNDQVFELFHSYDEKEVVVSDFIRRKYERQDFNDTRTVYFDFNVLKEYLVMVEEVSKKNGITPEGIKVVMGAEKSNGKNPFHTNVVFVPTVKNQGRQSAYTTKGGKIVYFKNIKPKKDSIQQGGFLNMTLRLQDEGLGLNGGRPIPPPNNNDPDFD